MGLADDIINGTYRKKKKKTTENAINKTSSNSQSNRKSIADSIINRTYRQEDYFPSRNKEETKKQEKTESASNKMSGLKAEALRKQYGDKLSGLNDIKLPKATNSSEKDKIINSTPLKDSANNKTKTQIEANPVRLNSYQPKEKEWYEKILQTPEAYKDNTEKAKELLKDGFQLRDGYELSKEIGKDTASTIGGTAADAVMGIGKGIIGIGENIGDGISAGIAQVADWTGNDEYAEKVRNNIANKRGHVITDTISKGQKAVDNNSVIGDTGDMATEGVGQALGIWALGGTAGKLAGLGSKGLTATQQAARVANITNKARSAATFASAAGGTFSETYQNEDVEDWQAWAKAFGTGYISQKIEKIGGLFSVGGADKVATNALTKNMESSFWKSAIRNLGTGIAEGGEESAEYIMGRVLDLGIDVANILTTNNDTKFLKEWDWNEFWNNIFVGTISGTTLGGGQTTSSTVDAKISNPDMTWKQAFNEAVKQQDIQAQTEVLDERKASLEKELTSKKLDEADINEIFNEMQEIETQRKELVNSANNIENSQETLYNNNESEVDINGKQQAIESNDKRGTTGLFTQHEGRTTNERGYQIINEEQITRTKQEEIEYIRKTENQITNLSNNQAKIKEVFESKGAKVVFYSLNSNKGGYYDNGILYINENNANDVQQLDEAIHEYAHYLIRDNTEFNGKISSIAEEIVRNEEYGNSEAIRNYIMDRDENISIEDVDKIYQTVVEEILADYAIDIKKDVDFSINNQYGIDINTLNEYKKILKDYLPDIELENSNESSFSMQQNKKIAPLPVQQNTQQAENKKIIAPLPKNYSQVSEQNKIKGNDKTAEILGQLSTDKMTLKENKDFLIQKLVNKGHYIDQLAKITKNKELTYKYDRMLGASSEGQYEVGVAQTDNKGNKIGKSINDIWKPAEDSKTVAEFSDYLLHKHNIDRMKQGKPVFGEAITAETSKQMVENYEKLYPDFKEWSKDIYNFNKNQLRNTTEAGLTSEELETLLDDMYSSYVTISRDKNSNFIDKKSKVIAPNKTVKKAVGGNSNIQPLKDAMAKQAIAVKQAIRRNDLGIELMNTLKTAENVETYDINNLLSQDKSGSYLLVFDKGQAKKLKITEGIYESLKPSQKYKIENTIPLKAVQKASSIQRSLLTVDNPIFMITNFFKDFQDGMFNSKYTSKFMKNYGKALIEIKNNGKYYNEYMANGGDSNTYFDYEKGVKKETKVSKFIDKIRAGNEIIEMAPRLAEYISTREAGGNVNEALYNAAEITTNFKRGGEVAKVINRNGANFLNASIQGLSKQIRNISGQNGLKGYVNLLSKATLLSVAPAILNHLLLGDDEEYQDLPDYVKDTYYLFKIGDNKFLRIPKGRVLSIFGSAARRTLEYAEGNKESFKGFGDTVLNQMAPNNPLSDNIFAPIVQASKNETWYGGDLVPTRLQDELPENQYDESTDSFSKWLGKLTGISPMKINYVIDQYSGGLGDILLPMMTPQAENNVLTDKFTIDSVLKNKNVSKFYETLEKQTQISNSPEATDEDMLKTKYLNGVQSSVSDLYKEKREIQLSDLNNKEKKEEVKEIQEKINEILEEGLRKYDKGKVYSNYATIGNEQYYKATNLKSGTKEWKKISEEEVEKNKNISLKTYADYKEKVAKETISQRKSGTIKEEGSLKSKDKIQILLDSNYANEEKTELYENYILNESNKKYPIIKQTGIDINEYMKYEQQEFTADKKDDGTVDGKSISGSKKNKVKSYIENMDITYTQKLVLYGLEYTPSDSDKTKIINYVKSIPDKTNKEKLEMLDQFEWITIYKNGGFKY